MEGGDNLKGLLFCERPNQVKQVSSDTKKPFLSRVQYGEQVGLNPVKKDTETLAKPLKKSNEILKRHKEWLEVYKLKMKYKKEMKDDAVQESKEKFDKIKEQAAQNRIKTRKMKEEFEALNNQIMHELDSDTKKPKTYKLTKENLKKLQEINSVVPKNKNQQENENENENFEDEYNQQNDNQSQNYDQISQSINNNNQIKQKSSLKKSNKKNKRPKKQYLTEQQYKAKQEEEEDEELDDLLGFVDNLNYDKYIDDLEVQTMVKAIKDRVNELKKDENWKQKAYQRIQQKRDEIRQEKLKQQQSAACRSEAGSIFSEGSKSVASERTMQSIQSLKEQMQDRDEGRNIDWDKNTKGETITFEQKIAKLVADEVLRNYKNIGNVHSNKSIRQMLEGEATKQLQPTTQDIQQRYDGPNINVIKERQLRRDQIDPNTLPYMHRNPAI